MTMKAIIFSTLVATVVAFAPQQQQVRVTSSLNEFVKGYVGGEGPEPMFIGETGSKNFDPAGLATVRFYVILNGFYSIITAVKTLWTKVIDAFVESLSERVHDVLSRKYLSSFEMKLLIMFCIHPFAFIRIFLCWVLFMVFLTACTRMGTMVARS
jgi:hypothetical protein